MEKQNISYNTIKKIGKSEGFRKVNEVGYDYEILEDEKKVNDNETAETFRELAKREEIKDLIYEVDRNSKALTGRTPEKIEEETGINKDIIFPSEGKILYVGDPWQRMGREIDDKRMVIIDYEFGDVASFIENEADFRRAIEWKGENLLQKIKYLAQGNNLNDKDLEWLTTFQGLVEEAHLASQAAIYEKDGKKYISDYAAAAAAWAKMRNWIEERYKEEKEESDFEDEEYGEPGDRRREYNEISEFRLRAWYDGVFGERGFKDIPDWNEIILPKLEAEIIKEEKRFKRNLTEEEARNIIERKKKRYIEEIKLKKSPQNTQVVEAIFPELPFKKNTFDRFIASWSISAHLFSELDKEGFDYCWKEILRVLTQKGEAYIFPLSYYFDDKRLMCDSLAEAENDGLLVWKLYDNNGKELARGEDYDDAYTLWIGRPG